MPTLIPPTVSSSVPTLMPIYSTLTTSSPIPSTIMPICDAITNLFRISPRQGPHSEMFPRQSALVQSKTSVQSGISSQMLSPSPPFNVHLEPADMEFLRKKLEQSQCRKGKIELEEGKAKPYIKIIAVLEQSQREGMGTSVTEPVLKQLQADR